MPTRVPNLIDLLVDDHQAVDQLLAQVKTTSDPRGLFIEIVRSIVVHEIAEEEIVYPEYRRIGGAHEVADARIAEQQKAEELLLRMEHLDVTSDEFATAMGELAAAVPAHAKKEESEVFARLRTDLADEDLVRLGRIYEAAKMLAPTHPHPKMPNSPPGDLVLGPIVGLIDKMRDAARTAADKVRT